MRNKKGFTLVELVIVIAVIAILAGVMIAVFSGVVKDAQESAELQKLKSEEIAMKADDVMKKLNDEKWFGWEDLEVALANGVAKSLGERVTTIAPEEIESLKTALGNAPTIEQIKEAVKNVTVTTTIDTAALQAAVQSAARDSVRAAFEEYKNAQGSSALTEEQMKAIVKGCFDDSYTGVTEEQMKTIIGTALDSWTATIKESNLTPAQIAAVVAANTVTQRDIQTIVDAAIANKLNTAQASVWVSQIKNQIAGIADDTETLHNAFDELKNVVKTLPQISPEDIMALIESSMPVTKVAKSATEIANYIKNLVSGSTIVVDEAAKGATVTVKELANDTAKTLYFKGADLAKLTIDAPAATVFVYNNVDDLDAQAVAMHSLYVYGKVGTATVNVGHVVFSGAVETLNVTPGVAGANIEVAPTATVATLNVNTKDGGATLVNNGTVVEEVSVVELASGETASAFVIEGTGRINIPAAAEGVIINKSGEVTTVTELSGEVTDKYIKLGADITAETAFTVPAGADVTLDTNGYTLTLGATINVKGKLTVIGSGKIVNNSGRVVMVDGVFVLNDATLETGENSANNTSVVRVEKNGKFIMNSGTVYAHICYGVGVFGTAQNEVNYFIMNGGTVKTSGGAAPITGNGSDNIGYTDITLNGGKIIAEGDTCAIYHPQNGKLTINGTDTVSLTGYAGIEMKDGILEIHGGTISTTGTGLEDAEIFYNGASNIPVAVACTVKKGTNGEYEPLYYYSHSNQHSKYNTTATIKVTITGGNFTSAYKTVVGEFEGPSAGKADPEELEMNNFKSSYNITGGFFSSEVPVANGYIYDKVTGEVRAK